jgi:hypothetical protein
MVVPVLLGVITSVPPVVSIVKVAASGFEISQRKASELTNDFPITLNLKVSPDRNDVEFPAVGRTVRVLA